MPGAGRACALGSSAQDAAFCPYLAIATLVAVVAGAGLDGFSPVSFFIQPA